MQKLSLIVRKRDIFWDKVLEDFIGMSGITIVYNNLQSISETRIKFVSQNKNH